MSNPDELLFFKTQSNINIRNTFIHLNKQQKNKLDIPNHRNIAMSYGAMFLMASVHFAFRLENVCFRVNDLLESIR